jgi:hypothetical protein
MKGVNMRSGMRSMHLMVFEESKERSVKELYFTAEENGLFVLAVLSLTL